MFVFLDWYLGKSLWDYRGGWFGIDKLWLFECYGEESFGFYFEVVEVCWSVKWKFNMNKF